jgi:hypothetical protein
MVGWLTNDGMEKIWKEGDVVSLRHCPPVIWSDWGRPRKTWDTTAVSELRSELITSRIQVYNIATALIRLVCICGPCRQWNYFFSRCWFFQKQLQCQALTLNALIKWRTVIPFFFFFWRYSPNLGLGLPPWNSLFHFGLLDPRHSVGLLGWVISSSQGLYL